MKSILVGNGIDIQFGGKAYSNRFILERIIFNAKTDKYDPLFENTISGDDIENLFKGFIPIANDILEGKYDSIENPDMLEAIKDFQTRLSYIKQFKKYYEIPLEDWFLLIQLFFYSNDDISNHYNASKQGIDRMILDAIYNDGKIQKLYTKMGKKVKKFFQSFDNVFTLNYDNNLESLCNREVFHLHGDFSKLADSINPDMIQGFCRIKTGESILVPGFEHCFCNALLNYSGSLKMRQAENNEILKDIFPKVKEQIHDGDYSYKTKYKSVIESNPTISDWFETYATNDNLKICSDYCFNNLKSLQGELYILGMSPQNDSHIFKCIDQSKVEKIVFYYFGTQPNSINVRQPIEYRKVNNLWSELDIKTPKYNINFNLPKNSESIIKILNNLSFDKITEQELIDELKTYPSFFTDPLCLEAEQLMRQLDLIGTPKDEKELRKRFIEVSKIALREGIYPTAFYVMLLQHMNKIKEE